MRNIDEETLSRGLQVTEANPMIGVSARTNILRKLGESLVNLKDIFGPSGRPGSLVGKPVLPMLKSNNPGLLSVKNY